MAHPEAQEEAARRWHYQQAARPRDDGPITGLNGDVILGRVPVQFSRAAIERWLDGVIQGTNDAIGAAICFQKHPKLLAEWRRRKVIRERARAPVQK